MSADEWLNHLSNVRRLSDATIRTYRCDLRSWFAFLAERGRDGDDADIADVRAWLVGMFSRRLAPATVNRRLSALRGYYAWGHPDENPFAASRTIKKGHRLPVYLTHEEIEAFLEAAGEDFAGLRDKLLFELLYSTGCRVGEICRLNVMDLVRRQVKVRGKGERERWVFVGSKAAEVLHDYLPLRAERAADDADSRLALILDLRGRRLTPRGVYYLVEQYARKTGLAKRVGPHSFRHAFATQMLDEGADLRTVQELLGHASLSTTQVYTHTGIERIKRVYRRTHPHARTSVQIRGNND